MIQHLQMPTQCAAKQLRMQLASNCIVHIMMHVTCGMPLQRGTLAAGCMVDSEHGANMLQFICKWFANAFASCSQRSGCLHCPVDNQTSHTRRLPFYPQPCTKMFKCFVTTMSLILIEEWWRHPAGGHAESNGADSKYETSDARGIPEMSQTFTMHLEHFKFHCRYDGTRRDLVKCRK